MKKGKSVIKNRTADPGKAAVPQKKPYEETQRLEKALCSVKRESDRLRKENRYLREKGPKVFLNGFAAAMITVPGIHMMLMCLFRFILDMPERDLFFSSFFLINAAGIVLLASKKERAAERAQRFRELLHGMTEGQNGGFPFL